VESFIRGLPKAELHVHIEGTLEPELMFELAAKNATTIGYGSIDELRSAYEFSCLQDFLDVYHQGAAVLQDADDFYRLTTAYLNNAAADNVRHAEIFFDAQTHTDRGVPMGAVVEGLSAACANAEERLGITTGLIMCFLRHLSQDEAMTTLDQALPYRDQLLGVGLASSEVGHPPSKFVDVFARARAEGLHTVAHAGEEGPPEYVREALDLLHVERIDHGIRAMEDSELVARLRDEAVPLTVCPLSNVKLGAVANIAAHPLPAMYEQGLMVTINSDDPAYFGGYVGDNYLAVTRDTQLDRNALTEMARNSVNSSFASPRLKNALVAEIDQYAASQT